LFLFLPFVLLWFPCQFFFPVSFFPSCVCVLIVFLFFFLFVRNHQ
jgi:hypothetical protein